MSMNVGSTRVVVNIPVSTPGGLLPASVRKDLNYMKTEERAQVRES